MRTTIAQVYLRLSLSAGFLWFGLDRLGAWGPYGKPWVSWGDWAHFSDRAHHLMGFLPGGLAECFAVIATIIEVGGGLLLLVGLGTRWAALACSAMTLCFALAMSITDGILSPLGYSVFTASAASLLLSTLPSYAVSVDALISAGRRRR